MIRDFFNEIKWFIQRGRRGWSDQDMWNFNDYLCGIIPQALRSLKDNQHGCPSDFYDEDKVNDECRRWKDVLEEMAQGFEAVGWLNNYGYNKWVDSKDGKGKTLEIDTEGMNNAKKKMDRGLKLFAENFLGLWD